MSESPTVIRALALAEQLAAKDPAVQRFAPFMVEKVTPMMAELLQVTAFDPKTGTGELSCSSCHTLVDETGKVVPDPREHGGHEHHH